MGTLKINKNIRTINKDLRDITQNFNLVIIFFICVIFMIYAFASLFDNDTINLRYQIINQFIDFIES